MTAPAVNSSPSDRPPPSLISPSPCTAWATSLGLHLNVLHDHIRSSAPEIYGSNSDELFSMMKSAAGTVAGAAALKPPALRLPLSPNSMLKFRQSRAMTMPALLICQRKSPQKLEILPDTPSIPFRLQDRLDTRKTPARPPTMRPKLPHVELQTS